MGGRRSGRRAIQVPAERRVRLDVRLLHRLRAFDQVPDAYLSGQLTVDRGGVEIGQLLWEVHHQGEHDTTLTVHYRQVYAAYQFAHLKETFAVDWQQCNYGGRRPWLRCPVCSRRCMVLYMGHGRLACRICNRSCS